MHAKRNKSIFKYYPGTILIILVSVFIFLLHILEGEYGNYDEASIIAFGGLHKELIRNGEVWRLFTYAFGHMSVFHFIMNAPVFIVLSKKVESMYGSVTFLLVFLIITAVAGVSIYIFYNGSYAALAGLSGAGYGLAGMLTLHMLRKPQALSQSYRIFLCFMLIFGVYGFLNTDAGIANAGHFGGFVAGMILAFILPKFADKKDVAKG